MANSTCGDTRWLVVTYGRDGRAEIPISGGREHSTSDLTSLYKKWSDSTYTGDCVSDPLVQVIDALAALQPRKLGRGGVHSTLLVFATRSDLFCISSSVKRSRKLNEDGARLIPKSSGCVESGRSVRVEVNCQESSAEAEYAQPPGFRWLRDGFDRDRNRIRIARERIGANLLVSVSDRIWWLVSDRALFCIPEIRVLWW